jgi:hypothetical protein
MNIFNNVCLILWVQFDSDLPGLTKDGQILFLKHTIPIIVAFLHYSLLFGYSFQELNDLFTKTQYLSSANLQLTYRRLTETLEMITNACYGSVDDFDETFGDVIRVRFLHGAVRYKIKKICSSHSWAFLTLLYVV